MAEKMEIFKGFLQEMFQMDQADLDFGIYRIMNQKRAEINNFLDKDLLPQVEAAFTQAGGEDKYQLTREMEALEQPLRNAGATPEMIDQMPKVKELRERLASYGTTTKQLSDEVFSHLTNFFRRYYKEGDFISQPRYKKGVYAIPYEGEEVKLHWANADQYYIKTTEYFRDYSFKLADGQTAHFKIVEATTEKDNNKTDKEKERRFVLAAEEPVSVENGELTIRFVYQSDKTKQTKLNESAIAVLKTILSTPEYQDFSGVFQAAPTEKNPSRTLLQKQLNDYTAKNSFDYFIHKDLGGFLRRELDFYLKNEVMFIDDLDTDNEAKVHQYLNKIKVIKKIGHKIIAFLSQLEDFQKKLWLKKKFVVETNYCVTLDRVPEELYSEIIKNADQLHEWKKLFAIDEIEGYGEPLTVDFLKANPFLVVDTAFFDENFKNKLLASIDDIDAHVDGLLVHSENFQALQLLQERYRERVKCIYIDPPYNTSEESFVYKNNYKHSSWTTMMENRTALLSKQLTDDGILFAAIDDEEISHLDLILSGIFGADNYIGTIIVQSNPRGRGINSHFATSHDYYLCYASNSDDVEIINQPLTDEQAAAFGHCDDESQFRVLPFRRCGGLSTPSDRPNSEFFFYYSPSEAKILAVGGPRAFDYPREYVPQYVLPIDSANPGETIMSENAFLETAPKDTIVIMPIDTSGSRRVWRWSDRKKIVRELLLNMFIVNESNGKYIIQLKDRIKSGRKPKTVWADSKYDASSHGTNLLKNILGERSAFGYPKSIYSTIDAVFNAVGEDENAMVLDVFAGSGTTGHAVIGLNREDGGSRKYVLVEMGEYFNTVTKPRIQKVIYSKDWKDGKPVSREGSSHMFKYIRLESYEDTLNNLALRRTSGQQTLIDENAAVREEYLLSYMLDLESSGSASLLDIDAFSNPFDYKLKIIRNNECQVMKIDLPETFNYLLGITVHQTEVVRGFKVIRGVMPNGEKALIVWRNLMEKSNEELDAFLDKSGYNPLDNEFDRIYVNGDNHIENRRAEGARWKVLLIEEEFKRLMFECREI